MEGLPILKRLFGAKSTAVQSVLLVFKQNIPQYAKILNYLPNRLLFLFKLVFKRTVNRRAALLTAGVVSLSEYYSPPTIRGHAAAYGATRGRIMTDDQNAIY